jgi:hypothetical protein
MPKKICRKHPQMGVGPIVKFQVGFSLTCLMFSNIYFCPLFAVRELGQPVRFSRFGAFTGRIGDPG